MGTRACRRISLCNSTGSRVKPGYRRIRCLHRTKHTPPASDIPCVKKVSKLTDMRETRTCRVSMCDWRICVCHLPFGLIATLDLALGVARLEGKLGVPILSSLWCRGRSCRDHTSYRHHPPSLCATPMSCKPTTVRHGPTFGGMATWLWVLVEHDVERVVALTPALHLSCRATMTSSRLRQNRPPKSFHFSCPRVSTPPPKHHSTLRLISPPHVHHGQAPNPLS